MPPEITPRELAARFRTGAPTYLVDVRQPWEHALVALPGSVLVPLDVLPSRLADLVPPPDALVVAYCHHGVRSLNAAMFLATRGWADVVSLVGGIDAWAQDVDPSLPRY
jgi:adenylyltransferase/sulfurtransferase